MITFNVVKEPCGWAIRLGERMTTSFWSREVAISEANALAEAIRRHGECTEVVVEGVQPGATTMRPSGSSSSRLAAVHRATVEASVR
jgi:hypothetical protein